MRKRKFSKNQRLEILAKWDAGSSVDDLSREYQVSVATLYKWKKDKLTEEDDVLRELIAILTVLIAWRGKPAYIRCDNGPEFIADQLRKWAEDHSIELRYIQPGKPSQNGLIERLNKTLRTECLNLHWFTSMEELNESIQAWSVTYNQLRPHKNLGYQSPMTYEKSNENFYFKAVAA